MNFTQFYLCKMLFNSQALWCPCRPEYPPVQKNLGENLILPFTPQIQ